MPIAFAGGHLAQGIILVNPIGAVGQDGVGPLVGAVVLVAGAHGGTPDGGVADRGQPVQVIILPGGGHAICPVLGISNLADQG